MKQALVVLLLIIGTFNVYASHIPGGNLTWQCTGNPNEYIITAQLFVSCPSTFGTQPLVTTSNNCGLPNQSMLLPQFGPQQNVSQICSSDSMLGDCVTGTLGGIPGVLMFTYQDTMILPGPCDTWDFSVEICCRDASTNTNGGGSNFMYFHSGMNSITAPCDNSPYVTAQPIPYVCAGVQQTYCPGAIDPDGDSLYFSLVNPLGINGIPITHPWPYSPTTPLQNLVLDPVTGCITFNQPTIGNFVVTYRIEAYNSSGSLTGFIYHDFQFEVLNTPNCQPPTIFNSGITNFTGNGTLISSNTIEVCEGQNICFDLSFSDPDPGDTIKMDAASTNILSTLPGATLSTTGTNPITFNICWTPPPGASPNTQFTLGISDGSCPIENLYSYTININVLNRTKVPVDTTICGNQAASLTAQGGGTIFNWSVISGPPLVVGSNFSCNPCSNPVATPVSTTTYVATSNLPAGCINSDTVTVTVVPDFTITTAQSSGNICLNDPVQLNVSVNPNIAGYNFLWSPALFLNSNSISNPVVNINTPGSHTYYINVTSPDGCTKKDSATIIVSNNMSPTFTVSSQDSLIPCNSSTQFTVSPDSVLATSLLDNFNGPLSTNWCSVTSASQNTSCNSITGNALHFDGGNTREAITTPQNVGGCTSIDFCLFFANNSSGGAPCENAETNEDVELSYSINGCGGPWTSIQVFNADDWDVTGPYNNTWQCFSIPIPPGAQTPSTVFKWNQLLFSGSGFDNWALDDVSITCSTLPTNYTYQWTPSSGLSNSTVQNPIASPNTTTTYVVTATNPNGGCTFSDSITLQVSCGQCSPVIPTVTNPTCKDHSDGSIIANPVFLPGSEIQTITWTDSITGSILQVTPNITLGMQDSLTGLPAGAYTISIEDTSGCVADTTVWLVEPDSVNIDFISSDTIICIGGNTSISANAIGGNGTYTLNWIDLLSNTPVPGNGPHNINPSISPSCFSVFATDFLGCVSSPKQTCVNLYPNLIATTLNDSIIICPEDTTSISMSAIGGSGVGYIYNWYQNGLFLGNGSSINITPSSPSTYIGVATDNCTTPADSVSIYVDWFNIPDLDFVRNKPDSCYPILIELRNTSTPSALIDNSAWNIGNDVLLYGDTVNHTFTSSDCYDVNLTVTTVDGCVIDTTKVNYVCPFAHPEANFDITPSVINILNTQVDFTNLSTGNGLSYLWNFGSNQIPDTSSLEHPTHTYPDEEPGEYLVSLIVVNEHGCIDTTLGKVIVNGVYLFYIPNSFSPDGDGTNDTFRPYGDGIDINNYNMQIFDRWGELIFETKEIEVGWDGTYKNKLVSEGTYIWKITVQEKYSQINHNNYGHVNVLR